MRIHSVIVVTQSLKIIAKYRANKRVGGARTQPCFTPHRSGQSFVSSPLIATQYLMLSCKSRINLIHLFGQPILEIITHNAQRGIVSKAFSRSRKNRNSGWLCSRFYCCSWRAENIASQIPLPGWKPKIILVILLSYFNFIWLPHRLSRHIKQTETASLNQLKIIIKLHCQSIYMISQNFKYSRNSECRSN